VIEFSVMLKCVSVSAETACLLAAAANGATCQAEPQVFFEIAILTMS
jgi:hypothetical protein